MLQDSFTPTQLQSLIEKYRKELLKAYGRQTVNGAEAGAPEKSAAKNQSEISDSQNTADATAAVAPALDDGDDHSPVPPSAFMPAMAPAAKADESISGGCPPTPSALRQVRDDEKPGLDSKPRHGAKKPANLQVKVSTGRAPQPVSGARVTVTGGGIGQKNKKVTYTDRTGCAPVMSFLNGGDLSPYTIEISANGFYAAKYSGIPLYSGVTSVLHVDLVPLFAEEKHDFSALFDGLVE